MGDDARQGDRRACSRASASRPRASSATIDRRRRAAGRRDHGVRRAAGRARPHLARAGAREAGGLWALLRARLLSFGMILGIAFLLMVSLVLSAALVGARQVVGPAVRRLGSAARRSSTSLVGFGLTTGVFAMIYKLMPRVQIALARRLARRRRHRAAVHGRQVPDRPVHRQERRRLGLRRRRLAGGRAASGSTTRRRSSCSAPSSPGSMPARFGSMREQAKASDGPAPAAPTVPAPVAPAAVADAPAPRPAERASARKPLADVVLGVAAMLALRYLVPRILRRM